MPNGINIPTPPRVFGSTEEKISQLETYLFRLSEQLMMILNSLEAGSSGMTVIASNSGDIYAIREGLRQQITDTAAALRKEIGAISLPSLGMRYGTVQCSAALAAAAYEDIAVEFDALPAAPVVVATLVGDGTDASCQVLAGTISETGFTVRVTAGTATDQIYSVAWTAIA